MSPVILGRARRNAECLGRFFIGHADEVTQLHQFRLDFVFDCKFVERVIDGEKLVIFGGRCQIHFLNIHTLPIAAMTGGVLTTGAVNEDSAHRLGGSGEEVRAILKLRFAVAANQSQPSFVNERGGLKRVARGLIGHSVRGQPSKIFVNQRQQFIGGFGIALYRALQDVRDVAHSARVAENGEATT